MRRPIVTKRSTANANAEKNIRPVCRRRISTSPRPCCESLRQQHPNNSKQHGALAKMGNMQVGLETLNQQRCSPGSWHSIGLAKALRFVKAVLVLVKKRSLQQSHFRGRKRSSFLDSKKWSSPVALKAGCSNKTQLWSTCVMRRASCLEQLARFHTAKNGIATRTAFRFGQGHSESVFNFYFNSSWDQKRARQIHTLERVATLFLGLRHDAQNASSCFKSSQEIMRRQNPKRMTQTSMCWTGEDHLWKSKIYYISNPKTSIKQIEQFNMSPGLRKKAQDAQDAVLRFLKISVSVALTRRLRFLRFSVYYAIYKMNRGFEIFESFSFNRTDKAFEIFFVQRGLGIL